MRTLFGTDGIRGEAGVPPLDAATVSKVGAALATSLGRRSVSVVVGCDTRESSEGIVAALTGGIVAQGGSVRFAGVVPTPAVAWLARELGADAGVVDLGLAQPLDRQRSQDLLGGGTQAPR